MEDIRIGVYTCWCGSNIAKMVDVEDVSKRVKNLPNVVVSKDYKYMCSDPGQDLIVNDIKENKLNRIVVAACSPRIHELTFRKALENAGLNPYFFEMANIREQDSWVHSDRSEATEKAVDLIKAAVYRVQFHEPLDRRSVDVNPDTLIMGGGISGMTAALEIAGKGRKVFLIEKKKELGGMAARLNLTFPDFWSVSEMINGLATKIADNKNIEVFTNTVIEDVFGYIGNFETTLKTDNKERKLLFGNIVVATGLKPFNPDLIDEYGYGVVQDVITSLEFEEMLTNGNVLTSSGNEPKSIAIIHCVGSRNESTHPYCSRVCCATALKYCNQIRNILPEAEIFDLYADMRAFAKGCEELYLDTSKREVTFLMFDPKKYLPVVKSGSPESGYNISVVMKELLSGETIEVPADMVILMIGTEAAPDAREIAHAVGISMCGNEFFLEKHPKLDPVATTTDGVYIVGSCQGPKDIVDSVSQARAAAARILATIAKKQVTVETTTAKVDEDICCGCQTCIKVCPYTAISFNEEERVSEVNEILCKGCGTCGSTCPTGAIRSRHFTDLQIISQIEGILSPSEV